MGNRIRFFLNRLHERLWVKPLMICLLSIGVAFSAGMADHLAIEWAVPEISSDSIETLLAVISASMLPIAVFAVGAMLSAYMSASNGATPRTFSIVLADDVSQNALSTFIGAFIFSIIALVALMNGYYERMGRFAIFLLTILVFAIVILSFIRWVDRIARLGRLGTTVDKVEMVVANALRMRCQFPVLGGVKATGTNEGSAVHAKVVGYVQRIDAAALQHIAEQNDLHVTVAALPGAFVSPGRPLAYVTGKQESLEESNLSEIMKAFLIGDNRTFDEDPRFGLIVLGEIASRALSPATNDPGTAIDIIGTLVRLFVIRSEACQREDEPVIEFDRVGVPEISIDDMFDDAFGALCRYSASTLEVAIRLQKAFHSLSLLGDDQIKEMAIAHAQYALRHAELALKLPEDVETIRNVANWAYSPGQK